VRPLLRIARFRAKWITSGLPSFGWPAVPNAGRLALARKLGAIETRRSSREPKKPGNSTCVGMPFMFISAEFPATHSGGPKWQTLPSAR
jgi:hypothetical protein